MLLATTQVEDFDRFLEIFSTQGAEKRKQHGSKGALVFRDPSEDDRVWVDLRLGRAGLAELRLRPRGPADHAGGRAQGRSRRPRSSPATATPDTDTPGRRHETVVAVVAAPRSFCISSPRHMQHRIGTGSAPWGAAAAKFVVVGAAGVVAALLITGVVEAMLPLSSRSLTATRAGVTTPTSTAADPGTTNGAFPVTVTVTETLPGEPVTITAPPHGPRRSRRLQRR